MQIPVKMLPPVIMYQHEKEVQTQEQAGDINFIIIETIIVPGQPTNLTVVPQDDCSVVELSWSPPPREQQNGRTVLESIVVVIDCHNIRHRSGLSWNIKKLKWRTILL